MVEEFKPFHIRMIEQELSRRKLENPRYSLRAFARYLGIGSSSLSRIIKNTQEISPSSTRTIIKKLKFTDEDSILFLASIAENKRRRSFSYLSDINADSLLFNSPGLIFVLNRKKQCLYVNEEAAKFYMHTPQEFIGKTLFQMGASSAENEKMSAFVEKVFEDKKVLKLEDNIQLEGHTKWYERIYIPVLGKDNSIQAVSCHLRDITERKKIEFGLNFLARSGKILSSSFDYQMTLKNIIDLIISDLADGCFIHIRNSSDQIKLFDVSHKDPEKKQILESFFKDYAQDLNCEQFSHHLKSIQNLEAGHCLCVPMNTIEKTIGSATLIRNRGREPFTESDSQLMKELGLRAAWAIDCMLRLVQK